MERIKNLTLKEMILKFPLYNGLADGLVKLPLPEALKLCGKKIPIPKDLEEFTNNICYGQRLFLVIKEENDFGVILRVLDGYFYTLAKKQKWDEKKALLFGKEVINCRVKDLYPAAMHIVTLTSEMAEREKKLLYREPSKEQKAAGIEKLNVFSELSAIDFLRDALRKTEEEVMLTPYNECLVRFMLAKETAEFQERYFEIINPKTKSKFHADEQS
jgi:hypothetical protein